MVEQRVSCAQCPVMQNFANADAELLKESRRFIPLVGQKVVDRFLSGESAMNEEVLRGAEICAGYVPMNPVVRFMGKIFDRKTIEWADAKRCQNPVLQDPDFKMRTDVRRNNFKALVDRSTRRTRR